MNKMINSVACALFFLANFWMVDLSHATEPFGNTFIVKEKGAWRFPEGRCGGDLIIENQDTGATNHLPLLVLFTNQEYKAFVAKTTAGPLWGDCAMGFLLRIEEWDYFCMSFWTGKRLLINLNNGTTENPNKFAGALADEETKQIEVTLGKYAKLISEGKGGFSSERLHGAMLLAARHEMKQVRPCLESIEEHSWSGPFLPGPLPDYLGYAKGLGDNLRKEGYKETTGRRFAQLTLRRLGFLPKGYPQYSFEKGKKNAAIPPEERKRKASQVKIEWLSKQVYELLGPPDYLVTAVEDDDTKGYAYLKKKWIDAWRYDFDAPEDLSLILIWDDQGRVCRMETIRPALWHGDDLFTDEMSKPVFRADGSVNGIHLYSPHFRGKISAVERQGSEPQPSAGGDGEPAPQP